MRLFDQEFFSKNLMLRRKELELTQEELATLIDESRAKLGHYETGKAIPPLPVLTKIANVLKVSIDRLVFGQESEYAAIQQGLIEATANENYEGLTRENEVLRFRFEDLKREMNTLRAYTALLEKNLMKYEENEQDDKKKTS